MIPIRDVIPSRTTPGAALGVIAVSVLVFLVTQALPSDRRADLFSAFGLVPATFGPSTLATSVFLHEGWAQVVGNMLGLWIFGDSVEDRLGHRRFLAFYLGCGMAAGLTHLMAAPASHVPAGSAAGAVAGVIAAHLVLFPRSRVLLLAPVIVPGHVLEAPAPILAVCWLLLQVVSRAGALAAGSGPLPATLWAVAGGFGSGLLAVHVFRRRERERVQWWDVVRR